MLICRLVAGRSSLGVAKRLCRDKRKGMVIRQMLPLLRIGIALGLSAAYGSVVLFHIPSHAEDAPRLPEESASVL
jgi:hypothetical protein